MSETNAHILGDWKAGTVGDEVQELRRHPRQPADDVVLLYWADGHGLPQEACAVIRDVSARGFGVETDRRFEIGEAVTVRTPERSLACIVRHAQEYPNSFVMGLEILSSSDGSSHESSLANLASALKP
jgi:hypothetical protein